MPCIHCRRAGPWLAASCAALLTVGVAGHARASEGGASFYLLGSGGPEAAVTPPVQGVFLDDTVYTYDAHAAGNEQLDVGGNVVAGLHAIIVANFTTIVWVPSTDVLGGTLVLGGALPIGAPNVDVSAVITGPLGRSLNLSRSDSAFLIGDPIGTAALGWRQGDFHEELSTTVNFPIGEYRPGQLANLAFHRWVDDLSAAFTWHNDTSGWDLSSKAGFTFNGENTSDDYTTGTEFHVEGSIEKAFSRAFSASAQAYYFDQVTGDSGAGAVLGPFKGQAVGVGGSAAYNFKVGKMPATLRFRALTEFDVRNRPQGTSVWLDFSVPLSIRLPTAPPQ